ncbi:hypothetical protein [Paraglaciecola sp.]
MATIVFAINFCGNVNVLDDLLWGIVMDFPVITVIQNGILSTVS